MIDGKKVLAVIPARGGSKGLPGKNIRKMAGKPLIAWTIKEAQKSKYIDRLILSSEDKEIIHIARKWGCEVPFVRPVELAQDHTPGIEPVIHAIKSLSSKYDYIILLQPTSPLRTAEDIDTCIENCINSNSPACVSVCEAEKSPYWMYTVDIQEKIHPFIQSEKPAYRRQDLPRVYVLNGAIYVASTDFLLKELTFINKETIAYVMPAERSVDIDTEIDFTYCELFMNFFKPPASPL